MGKNTTVAADALRLDKWLWHARFFKSRSLASKFCQSGKARANGDTIRKAHYMVRCGDTLTFPIGQQVRVVRIVALGSRRGPAPEAQGLYEDLQPAVSKEEVRDEKAAAEAQSRQRPAGQVGPPRHRPSDGPRSRQARNGRAYGRHHLIPTVIN